MFQRIIDQKSAVHLLLLVVAIGSVLFLTFTSAAPVKDALFSMINKQKPSFAAQADGLKGDYFNNKDLAGTPVLSRLDPSINFNWGSTSPNSAVPADYFSVRWTGWIRTPDNATGTYTFYTTPDDGFRLFIDNMDKAIDSRWWNNVGAERVITKNLTGGTFYKIKLEYYEAAGNAKIILGWSGPNLAKQLITQTSLYSSDPLTSSTPTPFPSPSVNTSSVTNNIMFGSWVGNAVNTFGDNAAFEKTVGQVNKIRHIYYSNESDETKTPNLPDIKTDPDKFSQYLQAVPLRKGEILLLSWASDNITNPETKSLAKINSGEADLYLNPFIDRWAMALAAQSNEIWINLFWEVNSCWGWNDWWCGPKQGNQNFIDAFRKIEDRFKAKFAQLGKANVKYVWNVDVANLSNIPSLYPGDSYVDITSFDGYPAKQSILQPVYNKVVETAPTKPTIIQETGQLYDSDQKITDLQNFFNTQNIKAWAPNMIAIVWFNENESSSLTYADSIIGKPVQYTQAWCDALSLNGYVTLGASSDSTCGVSSPTPSATPTPSPSPSQSPTATPTPIPTSIPYTGFMPTVIPAVSCITPGFSGPAVNISWTNPAKPVIAVQISTSASMYPRWDKAVSAGTTTTTASNGFNAFTGATGQLLLNPNTTYYTRLYNYTNSTITSFSLPSCQ